MENSREKRIQDAAKNLLTTDEKRLIAQRAGCTLTLVHAVLRRDVVDKRGITELCLEHMKGDFGEIRRNVRNMKNLKKKLNALDWRSINAGLKYIQQL